MKSKIRGKWEHWHMVSSLLVIYDIFAIIIAFFLALWVRFDCNFSAIPQNYFLPFVKFILIYAFVSIAVFWKLKLYNSIWKFASFNELTRVITATVITFVIHCVGITLIERMPLSYYLFGIIFQFIFVIGIRFSYRFILLERGRRGKVIAEVKKKRVMIIGAGEAGLMLMRDIKSANAETDVVSCFIDDNPNSWGRFIDGIPIMGGREKIDFAVKKYNIDKIFVAIPSATNKQKQEILEICKETGCELKNLPGMYQLYNGQIKVSNMQDVSVEDLLGRDPIKVNMEEIYTYIQGKVCMITGGGGSIGSELSRQVAAHNPKQLIIFDIYENNAYDIQQELKKKHPELNLVTLIGSVRDSRKLADIFRKYQPEIVYHAAAHKHVPLMEDSPAEAVKNNAIGTYKTAYAAMINGCKRFVLISTDKAVNPTNIMGASKRLCEMIIQSFDQKIKQGKADEIPLLLTHDISKEQVNEYVMDRIKETKTEFVAVRFGNVLGSNGSVIPLFKKQISAGGPVTVTHPDIIRYFMTIPEAVSLVMQAGVNASGGEIFVLDMGEPVKIDTLARNLIKLSGLKPDVDIKVEYTGLRPGEKLYEEKLMAEEGLEVTENELIHIGKPIYFDTDEFLKQLEELMKIAYMNSDEIREFVAKMVNTYKPEGL